MTIYRPEARPAEREAFCRACDKRIAKGQQMVSWYSPCNRGMNIHICVPCAKKIGELASDGNSSDTRLLDSADRNVHGGG